ncbi:MAG: sensor domain-containing protein [Propionibacteriaceae bacterium]|jgi:signal transduction histidine kinase|nr:sensor domain-containing protein [Propionibacteriaceae bacterium]
MNITEPSLRGRALPWSAAVWREYGYLWAQLLLCPFAFTYTTLAVSLGASLLVTVVGLFVLGGLVLGARGWGTLYRSLDASLLGSPVAEPPAFVRPRGFWRSLGAMTTDRTGWRALLYMFVTFPLILVAFVISTVWLAVGAGGLTYWFWWRFLPYQTMRDGTRHHGYSIVAGAWYWFADTPFRAFLMVFPGLAFLFMWAPLTRGFTNLLAALGRGLLGPTAGSVRVAELRRQRAAAVEDADAKLRRLERDLHDGTQARLVNIAMQLGEAREALDGNQGEAASLVTAAHTGTKQALTELRDIVRGIHPPALDAGLGVALKTLGARSTVPVNTEIDGRVDALRLDPAISSIAYYAVAELLANVAKHAHATHVVVSATSYTDDRGAERLRLWVSDNGRGGAAVLDGTPGVGGTGLASLRERIAAVDGTLGITSPAGGPTAIDITLPTTMKER